MSKVLIIAPGLDLRKSLQFALDAEGHSVVVRDGFHDADGLPEDFDCVVLDHHAAQGHLALAAAFVEQAAPVILLANTDTHPLAAHSFSCVTKPFLGANLSKAIAEATSRTPRA